MSYLVVVFDDFAVVPGNQEFKTSTIRFDIACPYDEWYLEDSSLRPYLIMQEIDTMFNQAKLAGIGNLQFTELTRSRFLLKLVGNSMKYKTYRI